MIRIAVTGASGFVGTALVEALTRRGYSVRAGTRAPMPCRPNV
ncbi:MAG: NAD-dependent epimerase/dehydratase family protein, partial [Kofleriaceae bacterium]